MNQQLEPPCVRETPRRSVKAGPPTWLVISAFAAVYVIWGSTYLGIHVAIRSIPPLLMAGSRFVIAGALLYAVMRMRGAPRPDAGYWLTSGIIGGFLLLGGNGGVTWAQMTVPTSIAALIVAATPLWMNLVDWLRPGGSRPRFAVACGIALGFAGVAMIVMGRDHLGNRVAAPLGAAILLLSTLSWAVGSVYSKHARQPASTLLAIAMQMICGGVLLLIVGAAMGETARFHLSAITAESATAFLYLTVMGSLVGFSAYVWLLQVSTPSRVSTYAYVNPLIAVLLGRLVLHEPFPESLVLAAALILGAVILITLSKGRREKTTQENRTEILEMEQCSQKP